MGLSLKPEHLKRYRDIARLLIKNGRSDLVEHAKLQMALDHSEVAAPEIDPAESRELAADLEAMGPTFIKLGQLLSSRPDLVPSPYIDALSRLQDRVEPFAFAEVEQIVTGELGARMSRLFLDFDPEPTAAASLGQVHRATPRDGRAVVVKVQQPGIRGRRMTSLSPLALAEMEAKPLAEQLFNAYLKQILFDGFFHADPHPGNVFLTDDGRVALLDLGMVGRVAPSMQDELLRMVLAISEARGEEVANVTIRIGDPRPVFDEHGYRRSIAELVAQYPGATAEQIEVGKVVLEISRIAGEHGIRPAPERSVLGKALLNLDQAGRILDPDFDPNAAIRRNSASIMHRRLLAKASPAHMLTSMLEMNDLVQGLPGKLNRVLDTFAENQIQMGEGGSEDLDDREHAEDRQPDHARTRPGGADHRRIDADAGRYRVHHSRLPRAGHGLFPCRGRQRADPGFQHHAPRPQGRREPAHAPIAEIVNHFTHSGHRMNSEPSTSIPDAVWTDYSSPVSEAAHAVEGNVKRMEGLWSPQLENTRDILVYLPPSYEVGDARYPVLYMHDGQNLFDPATSFSGEWHVDGTMEMLGQRGIEAIVVAVPNMGEHRLDEYSPFREPKLGGGKGDQYLDFLADTVKPLIDRDFRTVPDRDHTCIAGSSMGGLISLYAFFRKPATFGVAGVMSPALWFAQRSIFDYVENAPFSPGKIYLDIGTREGKETLADVRRMRDALIRKGYQLRRDLFYVEESGAGHEEAAWRRRIRFAVPFFFKRRQRIR